MPKRIETSKEMLLNFEAAYEQKSAEQMIQEIQIAIPAVQKSLEESIASKDQQSVDYFQNRLENLQNALVGYQEVALPREQEAEIQREQKKQEDLEDFGKTNFPSPRTRQKRNLPKPYISPKNLEPYFVEDPKPAEEYEYKNVPDPKSKDKSVARKKLKEKVVKTIEALQTSGQQNWMDDNVIADAVLSDPETDLILSAFDFSVEVPDEDAPIDPVTQQPVWMRSADPEDVEDQKRKEILQQIKLVKRVNVKELFEKPQVEQIKAWATKPNIMPTEAKQDEFVEGSEDEEYAAFVTKQRKELSSPLGMRKYKNFRENFDKEFEKQKQPIPSQKEWIEQYGIPSYYDWILKDDPEFQAARAEFLQNAENVSGKSLTEKELRNLDTHLNADWYIQSQEESETESQDPSGIRSPYDLPADMKSFPIMKNVFNEVGDFLKETNPEMTDNEVQNFAELVYQGAIDSKIRDMLYFDPKVKATLIGIGRAVNDYLGITPKPETGVTEQDYKRQLAEGMATEVWNYVKEINESGNKSSWQVRRKTISPTIMKRVTQGGESENLSSPEAVGVEVMRAWLIERIYEFRKRVFQGKGRIQKKEEKEGYSETPYEFIKELGSEAQDRLIDSLDAYGLETRSPQDAVDSDFLMTLQESDPEIVDMIPALARLRKAALRVADKALADAPIVEKKLWNLLYNPKSEVYRGGEQISKELKSEKGGFKRSESYKDWDKISALWEEAYGGFSDFNKGVKPRDETWQNNFASMVKKIREAILKEEDASTFAMDFDLPKAENIKEDVSAPSKDVKVEEKSRGLVSKRIAQIRNLLNNKNV